MICASAPAASGSACGGLGLAPATCTMSPRCSARSTHCCRTVPYSTFCNHYSKQGVFGLTAETGCNEHGLHASDAKPCHTTCQITDEVEVCAVPSRLAAPSKGMFGQRRVRVVSSIESENAAILVMIHAVLQVSA